VPARFTEPVARLDSLAQDDDQPGMEAPALVFQTESLYETSFVDAGGFMTEHTMLFNSEAQLISRMVRQGGAAAPAHACARTHTRTGTLAQTHAQTHARAHTNAPGYAHKHTAAVCLCATMQASWR
jgi:hypothetical protein